MLTQIVILLLILLGTAAFVKGGFAFTLIYLFLGLYGLSLVWVRQSAKNISCKRKFEKRAFWGEEITIKLEVQNEGWLPVPWFYLYESLPAELTAGRAVKRIVSLGPHGKTEIPYNLVAYKRGHYSIGPLVGKFGDTIGLTDIQEINRPSDHLVVYPRIMPITSLILPSRSPQGTLRYNQPIFEDPSRVRGKRDYVASDSLRRVDWKASASTGKLQVKQFEPSIALQTAIFLNLNIAEYPVRHRIDATELAVVTAASLANWVITKKQSVGLVTNGTNSVADNQAIQPLPPRKGRGQLIHILDLLAAVQSCDTYPVADLLGREISNLSWGTTVVVVTGQVNEALFDELFKIRRRGQNVVLVIAGHAANIQKARHQAQHFGIPLYAFSNEKALGAWRCR